MIFGTFSLLEVKVGNLRAYSRATNPTEEKERKKKLEVLMAMVTYGRELAPKKPLVESKTPNNWTHRASRTRENRHGSLDVTA